MNLTSAQQQAVSARGNVLVVAGAGTGKTRTLVERCLDCLARERPPVSLDEILIVTFTEAAAAEMRQRIRSRLEEDLERDAQNARRREQMALFDAAHIGTLHSFCLRLIRQHFYELQLDPQAAVMAEEEARLLAEETLDAVLERHYAGREELDEAVRQLIERRGRGRAKSIRSLVFHLHHYSQTLPDPDAWFDGQMRLFSRSSPEQWLTWLTEGAQTWRQQMMEFLAGVDSPVAAACRTILLQMAERCSRDDLAALLGRLLQIRDECPRGQKANWLKPLEPLFDDAAFLISLARNRTGEDPLAQDWNWICPEMTALLRLTREFEEAFASAKRELAALDFHDLEQHALRLLWDRDKDQPTDLARRWQQRLRFVFVDEYQDINAAQDRIIQALSRDGADSNRFLVGDVKQSIYRFRLARPRIFQDYAATWQKGSGQTVLLNENFRSREGILRFVNSFFSLLMRPELGAVAYEETSQLRVGPSDAPGSVAAASGSPRVELLLRFKSRSDSEDAASAAPADIADLEETDKEARMVAMRLRTLKDEPHLIQDEDSQRSRQIEWSDVAILLRSPVGKAEAYAKEFARAGIPLVVARGGFYDSLEISDLTGLLQLLDNPLQDVPAIAVLRSPLVGLTLSELAEIRMAAPGTHFWSALQEWQGRTRSDRSETAAKVRTFLDRFGRWRELARQTALSCCLETVLNDTRYEDWLLTEPGGGQRRANVQRLLGLARQFDQFQRQGLFRFLRFVDAQRAAESEPDVAAANPENAVRLMSIHQSKGLEFPVVAVADLGKEFNLSDLNEDVVLDEELGLCPQVNPPGMAKRYPSLPCWLARRRQQREILGEELRLLYVAFTRARETLILSASLFEKRFADRWTGAGPSNTGTLLTARSPADWFGAWFAANCKTAARSQTSGETTCLRWKIVDDCMLTEQDQPAEDSRDEFSGSTFGADKALMGRLTWTYPFQSGGQRPAKASVTELRRRAFAEIDEEADTVADLTRAGVAIRQPKKIAAIAARSGMDVGSAHHSFLQFVSLNQAADLRGLRLEATRMVKEHLLTAEAAALLDFDAIARFWGSEFGRKVRAHASEVRRELAFTARFSAAELAMLTGECQDSSLDNEFITVQGVADLAVILPNEIWLADFKTDSILSSEIDARTRMYEPQLKLYAMALSRIYRSPVTECRLFFLAAGTDVQIGL